MLSIINKKAPVTTKLIRTGSVHALVATFHLSTPPSVWFLNLEKTSSITFLLGEKDGEWDLCYRTPQLELISVAHFDEREDAEHAYRILQKTMHQDASNWSLGGFLKSVLSVLIMTILIVVLLGGLYSLMFGTSTAPSQTAEAPPAAQQQVPGAGTTDLGGDPMEQLGGVRKPRIGVPEAADDVLPKNEE